MIELSVGGSGDSLETIAELHESLASLESKIASLDGKVDALLKHAGIEYNPDDNLPEGVMQAIQSGDQVEAIKLYREATGAGLKKAKEFIENVQRRAGA